MCDSITEVFNEICCCDQAWCGLGKLAEQYLYVPISCTRGGIFTVIGARVNVRVRQLLFDSLISQEVAFFDSTKTGDLTSRLGSDCTKVGDQVTLNVNVFLR